jgi:putative ABC transport system permease protein
MSFFQDLRYALRTFVRAPGFAAIAVVTLALGIGANTAIFSVVDVALLRPLPYPASDELVLVENMRNGEEEPGAFSWLDYLDVRAQAKSFGHLVAFHNDTATLTGRGAPRQLGGVASTANLFDMLGVAPFMGRGFAAGEDEDGKNHVIVLTSEAWKKYLGADPNVLGSTLTIDQAPYTVIGVMPAGFQVSGAGTPLEYFVPMPWPFDAPIRALRGGHFLEVYGRLAPGASLAQASAEVQGLVDRLAAAYPSSNANRTGRVVGLRELLVKDSRPALLLLLGAVAFVLLIACANVANLLLARATVRQRELAIRVALGASRGRVIRQMLTESLLLAVIGGGLGVAVAVWGLDALRSSLPGDLTIIAPIAIDARVLGFTVVISLSTGILFGLLPALHGSASNPHDALKEGARGAGGGRQRARSVLVSAEVAVAMLLLVGAGLTLRSFGRLSAVDPGFNPRGVLTTNVSLPDARYSDDAKIAAFYQALKDRLAAIPGVTAVALGFPLPFSGANVSLRWHEDGAPPPAPGADVGAEFAGVNADFARAFQIPVVRGRFFTDEDDRRATPRVAVVNEAFAKKFFPGQDVVGRRIIVGWKKDESPREVVGILADTRIFSLDRDPLPQIYVPFFQGNAPYILIAARTVAPAGFGGALRAVVDSIDADEPIDTVQPMSELIGQSMAKQKLSTLLLGIFGALAVALALIGVYGVMSYTVTQRIREIGVRMALGARPGDVMRMVVRQGVLLAVIGVAAGTVGALALASLMSSLLFGVSSTDPVTYAAMAGLLLVVTALATWIPARRAARVDPMIALRSD